LDLFLVGFDFFKQHRIENVSKYHLLNRSGAAIMISSVPIKTNQGFSLSVSTKMVGTIPDKIIAPQMMRTPLKI